MATEAMADSGEATQLVLVGWDGSAGSEHAVRQAAAEAQWRGARLHVLLSWDLLDQPGEFDPQFDAARATAMVRDAAARLVPGDIEVTASAVLDRPASALLEAADTMGASLIVVGSRGRGSVKGAILGSVSHSVATKASVPVLVVPL